MKHSHWIKCAAVLLLSGVLVFRASAFTPYDSYTYSTATGYETYVHSPAPYIPQRLLDSTGIGAAMTHPTDFCFSPDGNLYISDTGAGKILILDKNYRFVREISGFDNNGTRETFNAQQGLYVASDGSLYICDTDNGRIVHLGADDSLIQIYKLPTSPLLGEKYAFKPSKVAVDESGTLYVINLNEYSGLMKISPAGKFISFIGSNKAIINPLIKIWKMLMSEEQQSQMLSFVPVEFKNMAMDSSGFMYTVSASVAEDNPVKRLNLSGDDILIRSGYVDVAGDVLWTWEDDASVLVDVCSAENGNYYVLDSSKGRIFTYNREGYLLYAFGGMGTQVGTFSKPCAIEQRDDTLLVLDETAATVTVFEKTQYADLITTAENQYYAGEYENSLHNWEEVLKINAYFELGYLQMGKIYLQKKNSAEAMRCFKLGNYRGDTITYMTGYNKAFTELRKTVMGQYLGIMVGGGLVLMIGLSAFRRFRKKSRGKGAMISDEGKA